jgi:hypothetical protein
VHKALLALNIGLAITFLPARQAAAQQATDSVAFIDAFKFPAKAKQAHDRLRASMEDALSRSGWSLKQGPADCGITNECMTKVARETGATYVLRVSGQRSREFGYDVSLDLYSLASGHLRGAISSCDICDSKRMSETAGKAAVDLLAKTVREDAELREAANKQATPPPPIAAPAPAAPAPAAPAPAPAVLIPPPQPTAESHHTSWIPWSLIGVGAIGMAYGGWALYKNGSSAGYHLSSSSTYAHDTYTSNTVGVTTMVGGGLFALAGAILLITTPSHSMAVSASPNHVALSMRF